MRWGLPPEQEELRGALRGWLDHHAPAAAVRQMLDAGSTPALEEKSLGEGWRAAGGPRPADRHPTGAVASRGDYSSSALRSSPRVASRSS